MSESTVSAAVVPAVGEARESPIVTELHGAVGIIRINRPARFNSMDVETARAFRKAGIQMARDQAVRVVILTGTGRAFCSGADLKYIRDHGRVPDFEYLRPAGGIVPKAGFGECFKEILEYLHSTISEIKRAPKPFIAAVNGAAGAGGLGIAMACDLVFASQNATFEWAYHKTGLTGAESSTFFLPKLVGLRKALELMLLNPRLSADEAKQLGLVTAVFPEGEFADKVLGVAQRLAAGPVNAYGVAKALMHRAANCDQLDYHLDQELEALTRAADSPEFAEGLAAFFEKRPPEFVGQLGR
jgi:2-(1,2-epoxy-1,2-dihydrophenyl)acetyl-CoA isomerase